MAKFVTLATGAALIGTGLFLEFVTLGASTPLTAFLISAGIGMAISGIGTLLTKGALATGSTATRSSVAPWNVVYGRARVGGVLIYFGEFVYNPTPWYDILLDIVVPVIALIAQGLEAENYWLDMVFVVACHTCDAVEAVLFDGQRIPLSTAGGTSTASSGTVTPRSSRTSTSPPSRGQTTSSPWFCPPTSLRCRSGITSSSRTSRATTR